ncbi:UNVERIFIED_CONTAM: hypothetical protein FKN15_055154 [Acipenser sinensis]
MTTSDIMFGIYLLKMVHRCGTLRYDVGQDWVPCLYVLQGQDPSGGLAYPLCVVLGRPACHNGPRERGGLQYLCGFSAPGEGEQVGEGHEGEFCILGGRTFDGSWSPRAPPP